MADWLIRRVFFPLFVMASIVNAWYTDWQYGVMSAIGWAVLIGVYKLDRTKRG